LAASLVFDLGGVLLNWQPPQLLKSLLPELSLDDSAARTLSTEIFQSFDPASDWARFDLGLIQPDELALRIAARTVLGVEQVRRIIDGIPDHLHALPGTVEILKSVAQARFQLETVPVFIDDMPINVEAAARHGWRGLRFENASALAQSLQGLGLLQTISS
jgi:FMN phosphatase YigB (HAD superfamily)